MKYITSLLLALFTSIACSDSNDELVNNELTTSDLIVSIIENPDNDESIGIVEGSSSSNDLSFTIINQIPNGSMIIDSSNGELTVANNIEFEYQINPIITATVEVSDGNSSEIVSVTVNLIEERISL
jgi:hypothetical protein